MTDQLNAAARLADDRYQMRAEAALKHEKRLLDAAPDLLAALIAVDEWGDLIKQNYPEMLFPKQVRAAIAKATA